MNDEAFEKSEVERLDRREKNSACPVTWGNCSDTQPRYWGKPTDTPHICSGPATHTRRGLVKLHICEKCRHMGGRTMPSPYSKSGAQLRTAIMNFQGAK